MTEPTSRYVEANGATFHLLDWGGDAQPCLMVHGTGLCAGVWTPIAEALSSTYHVMALDQRGHGRSGGEDADISWEMVGKDIAGVAEALDLQNALVIGHSRGASAVIASALTAGARYAAGVFVEPTILMRFGDENDKPFSNQRLVDATLRKKSVFDSREQFRSETLARRSFAAWDPAVFEGYAQYGAEDLPDGRVRLLCAPETEVKFYQAPVNVPIWDCVEQLRGPVLLLVSEQQEMFQADAAGARRFVEKIGAQVQTLPGDHFTALQHPRELTEAILGFTRSLD